MKKKKEKEKEQIDKCNCKEQVILSQFLKEFFTLFNHKKDFFSKRKRKDKNKVAKHLLPKIYNNPMQTVL